MKGKDRLIFLVSLGHPSPLNSIVSVAIAPNQKFLAASNDFKPIRLWNMDTGELFCVLTGHAATTFSVAFSPDGRMLATGSNDKTIKIWQIQ
jgi:WD40 repeat protein